MRIINESNKKEVNFFNTIIKNELENKLKKLTGIKFNVVVYKSKPDYVFIQDKKNVVSEIGAFGAVLKEIYISGSFLLNEESEVVNGSVDFRYTSKSGGTNGLTLINFLYFYKNGKLTFTDGGEKAL